MHCYTTMSRFLTVTYLAAFMLLGSVRIVNAQGKLVKVELFHNRAAGFARSDPIINQECASGHVHTFYGPKDFHPDTTYADLLNTPPTLSTSQVEENQSLYWHPTFYVVSNKGGAKTYTRVSHTQATAYYRWDKGTSPMAKAFPPKFRMIAASTDAGADQGGPTGGNLYTECCNQKRDGLDCQLYDAGKSIDFVKRKCDFLDIVFTMPTCWNGSELGDGNDHKGHMRYTEDGTVFGACPNGFNVRLPQIQLFVKIRNYNGVDQTYELSDGSSNFHIDFFNGWKEGKLQQVIDECEVIDPNQPLGEINPATGCTPQTEDPRFLTESDFANDSVCDTDVQRLIIDEATDAVPSLPIGSCNGEVIPKSWDLLSQSLFLGTCDFDEPYSVDIGDSGSEDGDSGSEDGDDDDDNDEVIEVDSGDSGSEDGDDDDDNDEVVEVEDEEKCTNKADKTNKFNYNGKKKNCKWVRNKIEQRCKEESLRKKCRTTCNYNGCDTTNGNNNEDNEDEVVNCTNNPDRQGRFKIKGRERKWCKWVQKNLEVRCKKTGLKKKCQTSCDYRACKSNE